MKKKSLKKETSKNSRYDSFKIPVFLLGKEGFEWHNVAAEKFAIASQLEGFVMDAEKPEVDGSMIFVCGGLYYRVFLRHEGELVYVGVVESFPLTEVFNEVDRISASQMLDSVTRNSSHQIFQSITSIYDIFEKVKIGGGLKNLDMVASGTYRVLRATNLFYEYCLLMQEKMELEVVDIFSEIDALCSSINSLMRKSGVNFTWSVPKERLFCDVDIHKFGFALFHLICNAYNFAASGNEIKVDVRTGLGGLVRIEIADKGSGMDPKVLENVVKPFFSYDPVTGDVAGIGLGLSYVALFADRVGGRLVISTTGEGTRVFLEMKVAALSDVMGLSSYIVSCGIGRYDYMVSTMSRCYFRK